MSTPSPHVMVHRDVLAALTERATRAERERDEALAKRERDIGALLRRTERAEAQRDEARAQVAKVQQVIDDPAQVTISGHVQALAIHRALGPVGATEGEAGVCDHTANLTCPRDDHYAPASLVGPCDCG